MEHFQDSLLSANFRGRPLDMNILGFWRGECTIEEKEETEQKMETSQNKFWGGLSTNILEGIRLKSMAYDITSDIR